jgi:hypothetical protein
MKPTFLPFVVVAALLSGCAAERAIVEGTAYPPDVPHGRTLDVQVFRRQTELEFTNTTAASFGPSRVWLNRWASRDITGLAPGEHLVIPLREFRDRYGEPFRGGGFWATQPPDRLGVAELQTTDPEGRPVMLGLVVVGEQTR